MFSLVYAVVCFYLDVVVQYDDIMLYDQFDVEVLILLLIFDGIALLVLIFDVIVVIVYIVEGFCFMFLSCSMMLIMLTMCASLCLMDSSISILLFCIYNDDVDASVMFRLADADIQVVFVVVSWGCIFVIHAPCGDVLSLFDVVFLLLYVDVIFSFCCFCSMLSLALCIDDKLLFMLLLMILAC